MLEKQKELLGMKGGNSLLYLSHIHNQLLGFSQQVQGGVFFHFFLSQLEFMAVISWICFIIPI